MNSNLLRKLIEKGAVRQGTVFEAYCNVYGLSCVNNTKTINDFILIKAISKNGEVFLEGVGQSNSCYKIPAQDIVKIDGMNVKRVAETYNFDENGDDVTVTRKRRGRKPKNKCVE